MSAHPHLLTNPTAALAGVESTRPTRRERRAGSAVPPGSSLTSGRASVRGRGVVGTPRQYAMRRR